MCLQPSNKSVSTAKWFLNHKIILAYSNHLNIPIMQVNIIWTGMMHGEPCMTWPGQKRHRVATTGGWNLLGGSWMWNSCVMRRDTVRCTLMKMKRKCIKVSLCCLCKNIKKVKIINQWQVLNYVPLLNDFYHYH